MPSLGWNTIHWKRLMQEHEQFSCVVCWVWVLTRVLVWRHLSAQAVIGATAAASCSYYCRCCRCHSAFAEVAACGPSFPKGTTPFFDYIVSLLFLLVFFSVLFVLLFFSYVSILFFHFLSVLFLFLFSFYPLCYFYFLSLLFFFIFFA